MYLLAKEHSNCCFYFIKSIHDFLNKKLLPIDKHSHITKSLFSTVYIRHKALCFTYYTYIPTESNKNNIPNPENIEATNATSSSFLRLRVCLVLVTSYTKNHAVKKIPIPSKTRVKWGKTAGFTGDA